MKLTNPAPLLEFASENLPEDWLIRIDVQHGLLEITLTDHNNKEISSVLDDSHPEESVTAGFIRLVNLARNQDGLGEVEWVYSDFLEPLDKKVVGLYPRYHLQKLDGTPVDPKAQYFVLRLDDGGSDPRHIAACRAAIQTYADHIEDHLPLLARDLFEQYGME